VYNHEKSLSAVVAPNILFFFLGGAYDDAVETSSRLYTLTQGSLSDSPRVPQKREETHARGLYRRFPG
jgi:hypothetical protein